LLDLPLGVPQEQRAVRVRFTYDINGVLQVEATLVHDQVTHELIVQQNDGVLEPQDIRRRLQELAALKVHPRDKQENIALLARTERLYEERLSLRPMLQDWIARFRAVLEGQDEHQVRDHRQQLARALDQLEATP
ncbi:MAG: molecular chaperone HscC, partial [Planctomycetia bacterium 21-64-5]